LRGFFILTYTSNNNNNSMFGLEMLGCALAIYTFLSRAVSIRRKYITVSAYESVTAVIS